MKEAKYLPLLLLIFFAALYINTLLNGDINREKVYAEDFALLDQEGNFHQLSYYGDHKGIILMSYGIGCPIVRHGALALEDLRKKYEERGYKFLFLTSSISDDRESLQKEAEEFNISIPILMDGSQVVARSLKLTRTAEVILINGSDREIVYRGALDDRLGYETQKEKAEKKYLKDAIERHRWGLVPKVTSTEVKGCLISFSQPQEILYPKDIVPILEQNCLKCHSEDRKAPWAMDSYDTVKSWSAMIREVVMTRRMPPYNVDAHVSKVKDSTFLTDEELKTLTLWIEQGSLKDEGEDPLPELEKKYNNSNWPLGEPDLVLKTTETQKVPATGLLDLPFIRSFEGVLEEDTWIKGVYYRSTNEKVLHHSSMWVEIKSPYQTQTSDSEPLHQMELITFNVAGLDHFIFPEGTGKFIPMNSKIKLYTHYITIGKEQQEQQQVGLYFHKGPKEPKPLVHRLFENNDFKIPENTKEFFMSINHRFDKDVILYGAGPHMHYRGRSAKMILTFPDGEEELLISVPKFDYDWLVPYTLKEPKHIPAGTEIRMDTRFDNSQFNEKNFDSEVKGTFGYERSKEMFWGLLVYSEINNEK